MSTSRYTPDLDETPRYETPRYVPERMNGVPVTSYRIHPPGTHPKSPIKDSMTALECVTSYGSRWFGITRGYINSELKMVVEGNNRRDEVRMKWKVVPEAMRDGR